MEMSDEQITKLCAEAIGLQLAKKMVPNGEIWFLDSVGTGKHRYDPLHDDAQAAALETVIFAAGYGLSMSPHHVSVYPMDTSFEFYRMNADMTKPETRRRWRCECVAMVQAAKVAA